MAPSATRCHRLYDNALYIRRGRGSVRWCGFPAVTVHDLPPVPPVRISRRVCCGVPKHDAADSAAGLSKCRSDDSDALWGRRSRTRRRARVGVLCLSAYVGAQKLSVGGDGSACAPLSHRSNSTDQDSTQMGESSILSLFWKQFEMGRCVYCERRGSRVARPAAAQSWRPANITIRRAVVKEFSPMDLSAKLHSCNTGSPSHRRNFVDTAPTLQSYGQFTYGSGARDLPIRKLSYEQFV